MTKEKNRKKIRESKIKNTFKVDYLCNDLHSSFKNQKKTRKGVSGGHDPLDQMKQLKLTVSQ